MNKLRDFHVADLGFFIIALASYFIFLLLAIVTRAGKGRTPLGRFNRLHFRSALLYLLGATVHLIVDLPTVSLTMFGDFLIGLFTYFGIHYAIVANFFVLAQASVSTSIIAMIHAQGGHATVTQCEDGYAGGEGFGYIKKNRMARIQNLLGWVELQDGRYRLTRNGRAMACFTKVMLRLWNLQQIGAEK